MYTNLIIGIVAIIFLTAILLAILYAIVILVTLFIKKSTVEEAKSCVDVFLHKTFLSNSSLEQTTPLDTYPVFIGFNGYIFRPDLIERAFHKLSKYWEFFYYENVYNQHPNIIVYQFRVYEPLHDDIKYRRLTALVQNVTEEALAKHMHEHGCFVPIDKFIAVRITGDILQIAIAKNNAGFQQINRMRKHKTEFAL